jgi:hypothetical protein
LRHGWNQWSCVILKPDSMLLSSLVLMFLISESQFVLKLSSLTDRIIWMILMKMLIRFCQMMMEVEETCLLH